MVGAIYTIIIVGGAISKCNLIRDLHISRELVCDLLEVCFATDIIFSMNMIVNTTIKELGSSLFVH